MRFVKHAGMRSGKVEPTEQAPTADDIHRGKVNLVQSVQLFAMMGDSELDAIAAALEERNFEAGEAIYQQVA